jgi:hypothetical protein
VGRAEARALLVSRQAQTRMRQGRWRRTIHEAPRATGKEAGSPMPDLTRFGVPQSDARAHVGACEECGRAYRHVVKNPKDAMALESLGRRIGSCLSIGQETAHA